jgi:hypothetical protein
MNKTQVMIAIHNNALSGTLSALSYLPNGVYHNDAVRVVCYYFVVMTLYCFEDRCEFVCLFHCSY